MTRTNGSSIACISLLFATAGFVILITSGCGQGPEHTASLDPSLSTEVDRIDDDGDGVPESVIEVTSRSGARLMKLNKGDSDEDGHFERTIRTIYADGSRIFSEVTTETQTLRTYGNPGRLMIIESDDDQDGLFETITLYGEEKEIIGILTRDKDGEIVPASEEKIREHFEERALFDRTVRPVMEAIIEEAKENQSESEDEFHSVCSFGLDQTQSPCCS